MKYKNLALNYKTFSQKQINYKTWGTEARDYHQLYYLAAAAESRTL